MKTNIKISKSITQKDNIIILSSNTMDYTLFNFTQEEEKYIKRSIEQSKKIISINQLERLILINIFDEKNKEEFEIIENRRIIADSNLAILKSEKINDIVILDSANKSSHTLAFIEGLILSDYTFVKYFTKKENSILQNISIISEIVKDAEINEMKALLKAVCYARDLVNEPLSYLTAEQLSKEIEKLGKEADFSVEIFGKKKIETLKMGGLLAVNKGSIDPPTFSILEWNPKNATNKKPYVLVGKGIVFDTGGLSLKPTTGSMDAMKSDMGGAAAVVGAIYAIAKAKLPIHIVGLIPATDNRPGLNAYAPQDVINMHNGMTVEVLNTDAEGRMVLADALSYADKYKPELIIDLATLTGAATVAVGRIAIAAMGNAKKETFDKLKNSGFNTYERLVELPLWNEYAEDIKSDVADMKNVGGREAGSITAGKFLEHFTNYPWIHLDIAGPAYLDNKDKYRSKNGTGSGVRLLFDFFKNI